VPDVSALPEEAAVEKAEFERQGIRSLLLLPLISDNRCFGFFGFDMVRERKVWPPEQISILKVIAEIIAGAFARRQYESELLEAKQEAEDANEAKSMFLANMSHELRTPLNAVIGYSDMLQEEAKDQELEDFIPDLERIQSAGKHLLAMINDILDLSKIEAGKVELYFEEVALCALFEEVESTVQPLVAKRSNALEVECPESIGEIRTDRTRLRQILFNLLSNAAKFTEQGTISLRAWREDGQVALAVSDTGIGMSEDQLAHLFEAFAQADASTTRNYGGTGLGMTITRHFTQMLGGEIDVDSVPDEGSTFTVWLPEEPPEPVVDTGIGDGGPGAPAE
jgi:signal transduction histidine kinase